MELAKALGSSVTLLLLGCFVVGIALLFFRKTRRFAKHWLLWITGTYVVFGLPVVANAIAGSLPSASRLHGDDDPIDTLVVFDGDNRRGRLAVTLRVLASRPPEAVWILGDDWLIEELGRAGYPRRTFGQYNFVGNTRDQVEWVRRFLAQNSERAATLVVSRLQAPRVAALADKLGLALTLLSSPIDDETPASGLRAWVPSYIAFRVSRDATYEHVALWHYRRNGWID